MTRKWSPNVCKGTNVEVCSLKMDSPCLLLEFSRVGERNVFSRIGWSYLLPAKRNEKGKERSHVFSAAFMVPSEVCPGRMA